MNWKILGIGSILALAIAGCGNNSAPAPTGTKPANAAASVNLQATADKLLADAAQYVKENKFDLADKAVAELEKSKPNLPAEYGPKIDQLKKLVDTAKTAAKRIP